MHANISTPDPLERPLSALSERTRTFRTAYIMSAQEFVREILLHLLLLIPNFTRSFDLGLKKKPWSQAWCTYPPFNKWFSISVNISQSAHSTDFANISFNTAPISMISSSDSRPGCVLFAHIFCWARAAKPGRPQCKAQKMRVKCGWNAGRPPAMSRDFAITGETLQKRLFCLYLSQYWLEYFEPGCVRKPLFSAFWTSPPQMLRLRNCIVRSPAANLLVPPLTQWVPVRILWTRAQ